MTKSKYANLLRIWCVFAYLNGLWGQALAEVLTP